MTARPIGRPPKNLAATLAAIRWIRRTRAPWRKLPSSFRLKWNSVYRYWKRHEIELTGKKP